MYKIKFLNKTEIRMGSPYNAVDIFIESSYVPDTNGYKFQDKALIFNNGKDCCIIQWDIIENNPGFIIWRMSEEKKILIKSNRFSGFCDSIKINEQKNILLKIWNYDSFNKKEINKEVEIEKNNLLQI